MGVNPARRHRSLSFESGAPRRAVWVSARILDCSIVPAVEGRAWTASSTDAILAAVDDIERLTKALESSYVIERELGGGGMSRVFLAEERALERRVVIKVLPSEFTAELSADRFRREIRVVAQLQHPLIVPVLQSGEAADLLYYTMPFVDGESVRSLVARQGPLPIPSVIRILRDVLDALVVAHARGIIHRDIKPDNILITGQHALVTDFGVAKAISQSAAGSGSTTTGLAVGTPAYMAPEQVAADPGVDHRADIYAVGVLAYELLTGRPPFVGATLQAVLAAHVTQLPEAVTRHRPSVPPRLADLVMRCLEKQPADRPQSAEEVLKELELVEVGATAERALPAARRRTALVIAGTVALVVAGAALIRKTGDDINSIAVLPFANVGGDSTDEYFSDGMTDELTSAIGNIPTLRVASRTSAFTFKNRRAVDLQQVGRQLKVALVLGGSVQRVGGRIRVRAQLTKVSDNFAVWSNSYEGDAADVFHLQDTVARSIANALRLRVGANQSMLADRPTTSLEAYDLYLKGRYAWNQRTGRSLLQAANYFEDAISRDPKFARAHAGIAEVNVLLPFYATVVPLDAWKKAKAAAGRALDTDSTLVEARTALAYGLFLYERDFPGAEREFRRALADDPRNATAHQWHADMLGGQGRIVDRLEELRRAQELDPLSRIFGHEIAQTLFVMGRLDEAIAVCEQTLALDPTFPPVRRTLGLLYVAKGRRSEGLTALKRSLELSGRRPIDIGHLARIYALGGQRDSAMLLLRELQHRRGSEYIPSFAMAIAQHGLGNTDEVFVLLNQGLDAREPSLAENWFDPAFASLHSDPRWLDFLRRLGVHKVDVGAND